MAPQKRVLFYLRRRLPVLIFERIFTDFQGIACNCALRKSSTTFSHLQLQRMPRMALKGGVLQCLLVYLREVGCSIVRAPTPLRRICIGGTHHIKSAELCSCQENFFHCVQTSSSQSNSNIIPCLSCRNFANSHDRAKPMAFFTVECAYHVWLQQRWSESLFHSCSCSKKATPAPILGLIGNVHHDSCLYSENLKAV